LLSLREDIFDDYNEEQFVTCLERHAKVHRTLRLTNEGRLLVWYHRKDSAPLQHRQT